ncbi:conserved protein of unknown function [Candidatus Filomicrobium marinum]|uniref:Tetratricopeptide repeat protein n=1 Tax=Candidatus Filomicrobium marinum TaxID=1608628 RepID=A0A0D6JJA9_9HYPH|nr:hypothetical protein [Candidatus Filomicrobium marinum]CFX30661.1 conserved protein of unknown function [Candidatus Filomicrobium marinum]CPR22069.1 conserved protein of unknown function [Candidatus Filomicrobium marinum]
MNPLVSIDGPVGWAIVASPLAVLAIIALTSLWAGWSGRKDASIDFDSHERHAVAPLTSPVAETVKRVADFAPKPGAASAGTDAVVFEPEASDVADVGGAAVDHAAPQRNQVQADIAAAGRVGDPGPLAALYLSLALLDREAGDEAGAAASLRQSVVFASQANNPEVHARARLELGDIAHRAGDLTMACEHWQMARSLFELAELADEKVDVDARMQRNGCPTDWVLTDF